MANYIRRLGWNAVATNMNSYVTLMPQIALACGIGEVSRMGIVLNPFLGANFKVAAVLTDMELEADGYVDFGLQDYCASCTDLRRAVPCPRDHPRQADALQRLLHVEAQRPRLQRLRRPEQGGLRVRPVHQGVPLAPARTWRRATSRRGTAISAWLHATVDEQRERLIANDFVDPQRAHRQVVVRARRGRRRARRADGRNESKICREYPLQR